MNQDKLEIALELLMEFVCDKRCIYAHDLNTYQPNDEAAYDQMLDTKCEECSEKIEEILRALAERSGTDCGRWTTSSVSAEALPPSPAGEGLKRRE